MQILLIEDDRAIADFIAQGLRETGHVVTLCADGRDGLIRATCDQFDVIILDRMLPSIDGLKILSAIRAGGDNTPVLILSALADVDERVRGLKAGGDDYLAKPFSFSELIARVEALARRNLASADPVSSVKVADLHIDLVGQRVRRGGRSINLTTREFRILTYMAENIGRVVTRTMLLERVWDYNFDPQTNIVDQHISNLRQKLDRGFETQLIHTVRGSGYMLRAEN